MAWPFQCDGSSSQFISIVFPWYHMHTSHHRCFLLETCCSLDPFWSFMCYQSPCCSWWCLWSWWGHQTSMQRLLMTGVGWIGWISIQTRYLRANQSFMQFTPSTTYLLFNPLIPPCFIMAIQSPVTRRGQYCDPTKSNANLSYSIKTIIGSLIRSLKSA